MSNISSLTDVSTAATLISAAAGVATYVIRARGRERLAAIQRADKADKAKLVVDAIAMFDISVEGLSAEQRVLLVMEQLRDRDRQRGRMFALSLALMLLLASTTIALVSIERSSRPVESVNSSVNSNERQGTRAPDEVPKAPANTVQQTSGSQSPNINGNNNNVHIMTPNSTGNN